MVPDDLKMTRALLSCLTGLMLVVLLSGILSMSNGNMDAKTFIIIILATALPFGFPLGITFAKEVLK